MGTDCSALHAPSICITQPFSIVLIPCPSSLHAADYIALANARHTLALSGVPVFTAANRTAAYRFVTLVDVLYEHRWGARGKEARACGRCLSVPGVVNRHSDPLSPPSCLSFPQGALPVLGGSYALRAV